MTSPHERRLRADLEAPAFQAGAVAGAWRLVSVTWPTVLFALPVGGVQLGLRVDVEGYPSAAPAGQPWDLQTDRALPAERWPEIGAETRPFRRDWSVGNGNAPYIAADRVPLASHPNWAAEHPERAWHSGRDIAFYLSEIARELRGTTVSVVAA